MQAKWTDEILDEMTRNLGAKRPDISPERLVRLRELINSAVADCLVTGYGPLIKSLELPDPDDRHVLAAAITSGAQVIVTTNTKDFPAKELQAWNVEAKPPASLPPLRKDRTSWAAELILTLLADFTLASTRFLLLTPPGRPPRFPHGYVSRRPTAWCLHVTGP